MAKQIIATQQEIDAFTQEIAARLASLKETLKSQRFGGDTERALSINLKLDSTRDERTATLVFTPKAWVKMQYLVHSYSSEVQWHGIVSRVDETTFAVTDILIFPHEVTGTTVVSNHEEYQEWLDSLDDDTFNALRFHGHSHVYMDVSPSKVDMDYRQGVLNNFGTPTEETDLFYIFLIINKKGDKSAEIYDLQNNALYSTKYNEISIEVLVDDDEYLQEFELEAKRVVKTATIPVTYGAGKGSTPKKKKGQGTPTETLGSEDDDDYGWQYPYYGGGFR